MSGPSPRVRGSRLIDHRRAEPDGTIPAGAGEPRTTRRSSSTSGDHPRGCGGAIRAAVDRPMHQGPSPRVRGSQYSVLSHEHTDGTIPAGAGEPRPMLDAVLPHGDHPRGCGGAQSTSLVMTTLTGPSPRVRGSPTLPDTVKGAHGTIPVGAGEPSPVASPVTLQRDHPRGCGGAGKKKFRGNIGLGPSPRVRGSLTERIATPMMAGTIPAGAGEPLVSTLENRAARDHPRGCGGAARISVALSPAVGPSPRVRGSLYAALAWNAGHGTIPAGAGEPAECRPYRPLARDHPRGCGGAIRASRMIFASVGPSPRVRGSPSPN